MFTVEMLPAKQGDCLWIEFGSPESPRRILIDGGVFQTQEAILAKLTQPVHIDLLIITHIDNDHIGGILRLLQNPPAGLTIGDIWFNDWKNLVAAERLLGSVEGERAAYLINARGFPHNVKFEGGPAVRVPGEDFPTHTIDEMKITLLAPTPDRLIKLRDEWEKVITGKEMIPGEAGEELESDRLLGEGSFVDDALDVQHGKDTSVANGSSIAVLLEYDSKSLLCLGDSFPEDIVEAVETLSSGRLTVHATKLSHHGGKSNTSVELIEKLYCSNWLISTDGSGNAHHPHATTLARIIRYGNGPDPHKFIFNYCSDENEPWRDPDLQHDEGYVTDQPGEDQSGIVFDFEKL